jgi:hypothetical protein
VEKWYDPTSVGLLPLLDTEPWQMSTAERAYFVLLLSQLRPRRAIEVGSGGSTVILEKFCRKVTVVDPYPSPAIADLAVRVVEAPSQDVLARLVKPNVEFVLIDGDHGPEAVAADVRACLGQPKRGRVLLLHDTGNSICREAIESVDLAATPWVHHVDLDAVPGVDGWGGLGVVHLNWIEG